MRERLRTIVDLVPDVDIVGTAADGAQAVASVAERPVDLGLMDLHMPIMNRGPGDPGDRRLPSGHAGVDPHHVADESRVLDAIRAGASGYLLQDAPRDRLVDAIRWTMDGQTHLDLSVAGGSLVRLASQPAAAASQIDAALTEREREVLSLVRKKLAYKEIAERMYVDEGTVRNYASAVLAKLGVHDRTQAAVLRGELAQTRGTGSGPNGNPRQGPPGRSPG